MYFYCPECGNPLTDTRIKNPHNEKEEFCSEECARLNRVDFCQQAARFYVLLGGQGECRGVYSKDNLHLGINYWMEMFPNEILSYQEWCVGYPQEPETWDWCYIPVDSDRDKLAKGGGSVPKKEYWGQNIFGVLWEGDEE